MMSNFKVAEDMKRDLVEREETSPVLTASEVSRLLNVHINTVRRWSNQGILKSYRIGPRGDRRFQQKDVTSFLSKISLNIVGK